MCVHPFVWLGDDEKQRRNEKFVKYRFYCRLSWYTLIGRPVTSSKAALSFTYLGCGAQRKSLNWKNYYCIEFQQPWRNKSLSACKVIGTTMWKTVCMSKISFFSHWFWADSHNLASAVVRYRDSVGKEYKTGNVIARLNFINANVLFELILVVIGRARRLHFAAQFDRLSN